MAHTLAYYQERVAGTNIDPRSLLSTDYFNLFNSVIMLYGMLREMPELLDEIEAWQFLSYTEHYKASGLDFAELAIEAYPYAPTTLREPFERKVEAMRELIETSRVQLRKILEGGDKDTFAAVAIDVGKQLQKMADEGGAIVHGQEEALDQSAIDKLF